MPCRFAFSDPAETDRISIIMKNMPTDFRFDSRGPRRLVRVLLAVIVLLGILSVSVELYIDKLWFESLGFESVYWYGIEAWAAAFVIFFVSTLGATKKITKAAAQAS